MQLHCPHCAQVLEFSAQQPRFCSSCGGPLSTVNGLEPTVHYDAKHYDPNATQLHPFGPGSPTAAPETVGGYRLLRAIGSGGMGTVYEAEEIGTRRRVALKLIRQEFAASEDALERFRREGRLAGTIVHPRCVFVLAADEDAGRPYIVMELMPGETLADVVARRGPLPTQEAVALILDVIEGLQEAHRCGLIHRDVKPSNCFLDADGRVKIGDFGLAKSLIGRQGGLTQTGSFLGTVLFAAPEQIRNDKVDRQADVYSVAATLYFLLTGKAPFETDDPAATLARTLSDPLTPMRELRPDLPRTLDGVVLRGLARPRERRWQGLEGLRLALLPFVPGTHALGEIGWRFVAYLVDSFVVVLLEILMLAPVKLSWPLSPLELVGAEFIASVFAFLVWFALPEKLWGCSLGKYLFRLRVRGARTDDRPTWTNALVRTFFFWLFRNALPGFLNGVIALSYMKSARSDTPDLLTLAFLLGLELLPEIAWLACVGLIVSTMRRRNGYRGLHEFLSGTKVIRLPVKQPEQFLVGPAERQSTMPTAASADGASDTTVVSSPHYTKQDGLHGIAKQPLLAAANKDFPERIGAFSIRSCLRSTTKEQVLLGVDEVLDREVWIWLRPAGDAASAAERREVNRTTRPRWLASGQIDHQQWDAFVASPGCVLGDLVKVRRRLSWPEVRPVLEQLAEELSHACEEGALPLALGVEQVWVQSTGRVQLLDTPLRALADTGADDEPKPEPDAQRRSLTLLRQTAVLMLEGMPRLPSARPGPLRAPVPRYATEPLARLTRAQRPYARVQDFLAAMQEVRHRPPAVSRTRRGIALVLQGLLLALGVGCMLAISLNITYLAFVATYQFPGFVGEVALEDLDQIIGRESAALLADSDPLDAPARVAQLNEDLRLRAQLKDDLKYIKERREVVLGSSSSAIRRLFAAMEKPMKDWVRSTAHLVNRPTQFENLPIEIAPDLRRNATNVHRALTEHRESWNRVTLEEAFQGAAPVLVWPVLWLFWAGLTRGGVCLPLVGVALVQKDGRRAARWRCIVRSFLVWLPFVGLLVASLLLDLWRISAVTLTNTAELEVLAWLAWSTWWLALVWLPVHLVLCLGWPNRGWHDWLAGTYLVPR